MKQYLFLMVINYSFLKFCLPICPYNEWLGVNGICLCFPVKLNVVVLIFPDTG